MVIYNSFIYFPDFLSFSVRIRHLTILSTQLYFVNRLTEFCWRFLLSQTPGHRLLMSQAPAKKGNRSSPILCLRVLASVTAQFDLLTADSHEEPLDT